MTQTETDVLTTFRIRLSKHDVEGVRDLARKESVRQGLDLGWCDLVRGAMRQMVQDKTHIA